MPKYDLDQALARTPRPAQHQGSLTDQLVELQKLAIHFGLYDAHEWLQRSFNKA